MPDGPIHLILIDGSGFIFRAFHALPPMTRADGTPVNAVFGFTNMLAKLLRDHGAGTEVQSGAASFTHLAVIFDAGRTTFRNRIYDQYKATRPPPPDDLMPQFALVRDATAAFGVPAVELDDWEADDLIASYCREVTASGGRVTIISSDKDLMQLLRPGVEMLDPIKQKPIGADEVREKFGVAPDRLIDVQALIGDKIDNVPGVPGIGPKNAAQLLAEFGDLETILTAAPAMKPSKRRDMLIAHAENARLSRTLVTLREDAPLPAEIADLAAREPDRATLGGWLAAMGFRSVLTRLGLEDPGGVPVQVQPRSAPGEPAPQKAIEAAHPGAAFGPYDTLTTAEAFGRWLAEGAGNGRFALEAIADDPDPMRATLIGLAIALRPGRAAYMPLRHADLAAEQVPAEDARALLAPVLADPHVLKIMPDAKRVLALLDAPDAAAVDDPLLMSYSLDAGLHGHALDELAALHLEHKPAGLDAVTGIGRARLPLIETSPERMAAHAAEAADIALRLWLTLRPRLRTGAALALYEQVERRLTPVLLRMERDGVKVDADDLRRMSGDFEQRMAAMEAEIHGFAGRAFNLGSPKQLGEVLFDEMKLPGGRRMKTGAWGTDASVLQDLAEQGFELPARILEWRQLAKLKTTYADALVNQIDPRSGRVHTRFQMAVASTGRLSSTDPNLQNIPIRTEEGSRIRRAFIAEPDHVLLSCDYSQIELRLLAHVADIPQLRESFRTGEDIHARTASEVFGVPMAGMDALTRRRAKAINFGIIYGISPFGLARQLGIAAADARFYIEAYFARYPGIRAVHGTHQGGGADRGLRDDAVRPALLDREHRRPQSGQARLRRTAGDQRAAAGRGRRHHQARHGPSAGGAARGRAALPAAAAGARRVAVRGAGRGGGGAGRRRPAGDGGRGLARGAARRGDRDRADLGGGALADRRIPGNLPTLFPLWKRIGRKAERGVVRAHRSVLIA